MDADAVDLYVLPVVALHITVGCLCLCTGTLVGFY